MVGLLEGKGSVTGSKGRIWIYVPAGVANDSAFPFKKGDKVNVEIKEGRVIVTKK